MLLVVKVYLCDRIRIYSLSFKREAERWLSPCMPIMNQHIVPLFTMLLETGRAAVIHPTGTGKSFIDFKLCENNPDKTVCWLSPSEYIFEIQLENQKKATDGWEPENIHFYTYAWLMNFSENEIRQIQPDFLILDKFHRCGAE